MTKEEALKLALEALENHIEDPRTSNLIEKLIAAIKEALAQTQEPVAWEQFYPDIGKPQIAFNAEVIGYVAPQRTWVGLTDEEVKKIAYNTAERKVAKDIEAKLKEKNDC